MSEAEQSAPWDSHVSQAAKSFLKCAVVIDDRPFGGGKSLVETNVRRSDEVESRGGRSEPAVTGPIPRSPKTANHTSAKTTATSLETTDPQSADSKAGTDDALEVGKTVPGADTHDLDLRALTDSFAEEGIICGTLIPENLQVENETAGRGEASFVNRAQKMAQTADILIIDWFLKKRNSETTLKILETVLQADKDEGGRTRLICIYTGEDQLQEICDKVRDHLKGGHNLEPSKTNDTISLTNRSTSIVFLNKKKVEGQYTVKENELPKRLIREFTHLINGLLPSFAASSIGAIRRNTHGILDIFCAELDPAYVGNRVISDPPEDVAQLVRELLVSEFDNQIGFAKSTDKYLSKKAICDWLQIPGRVQSECTITKMKREKDQWLKTPEKVINTELFEQVARGDIATFGKSFKINGDTYRISEKQRLKFTQALCKSENEANEIEERFARLASNKREAFGRETTERGWRPSLTLGTLLQTKDAENPVFYVCITRACDMVRLSKDTESVVLLRLDKSDRKFNLVVPDMKNTVVKLIVPREFSDMRSVEFEVNSDTQRITAKEKRDMEVPYFQFDTKSDNIEYVYLGELRYLRTLRDVDKIIRSSTAIGIADSEWLRLSEKN